MSDAISDFFPAVRRVAWNTAVAIVASLTVLGIVWFLSQTLIFAQQVVGIFPILRLMFSLEFFGLCLAGVFLWSLVKFWRKPVGKQKKNE